ncbi:unnamed protein product, partial [Brassica oleracea var. botrytis]
ERWEPNDRNHTKDGIQIVLMGTIVGTKSSANELSQGIESERAVLLRKGENHFGS